MYGKKAILPEGSVIEVEGPRWGGGVGVDPCLMEGGKWGWSFLLNGVEVEGAPVEQVANPLLTGQQVESEGWHLFVIQIFKLSMT